MGYREKSSSSRYKVIPLNSLTATDNIVSIGRKNDNYSITSITAGTTYITGPTTLNCVSYSVEQKPVTLFKKRSSHRFHQLVHCNLLNLTHHQATASHDTLRFRIGPACHNHIDCSFQDLFEPHNS